MKISYMGTGYVGQVSGAVSAHYGHDVWLIDIDKEKVNSINQGKPTIFEKDLDEMIYDLVINKKKLHATLDTHQAVLDTEASFICVGTPDRGGMIDLSYIQDVSKSIGLALKEKNQFHIVIVKSTVVPGTTINTVLPILEEFSGKRAGIDFGIAMNPEFLREGLAVSDNIDPDNIVIGTQDEKSKMMLKEIYSWADEKKFTFVNVTAAEAIKYAQNSFLAMKITFANEWGNYCDLMGIDAKEVLDAIGADRRISPMFLRNGPGYGGSCFPKDVEAIVQSGQVNHSPFRILEEVIAVNNKQYLHLIDLAKSKIGSISRRKVGILGLSFKPNTDDTRESPALKIISYLVSQGCEIKAFCPQGIEMAEKTLTDNRITDIKYAKSAEECVQDVEFVLIPTDWPEFRDILPKITVPTFVGHRSFVNPDDYANVFSLGYPKK